MEYLDKLIEEKRFELEELIQKKNRFLFPAKLISIFKTRYYYVESHNTSSGAYVDCGPSVGFWSFRSRTSFDSISLSESCGQFTRFKSIIYKVIEDFTKHVKAQNLSYNAPNELPDKYLDFLSKAGFIKEEVMGGVYHWVLNKNHE
jgi:hypothetical protein